jgi:formylglycine-generating enzyme required for sulfatase activity
VIEYLRGSAQARYYDEGKIELNGLVSYVGKNTNDYVIQKRLTSDGQFPVLRGNTSNWTLGNPPTNPMRMTNSLQMEFALIPAGTFQMGTRLTQEQYNQRYPDKPDRKTAYELEVQHEVQLTKSFYLGVHEVTVGQFRKFIEAEGYKTEAERDEKGGPGFDSKTGLPTLDSKYNWRNPGFEQDDKHPVVNVSWNDAVAFCKWLRRIEGRDYRLPTEAQWEYACRAGSTQEFTFGDDAEQLVAFSNVADSSFKSKIKVLPAINGNDGSIFTSRVGSYRSNAFGLHDMHGNVVEWCSDWVGVYPTNVVVDPVGPATGWNRVMRGGAWCDAAVDCRSARRNWNKPDFRGIFLGFRVALSPSGIPQSPEADK